MLDKIEIKLNFNTKRFDIASTKAKENLKASNYLDNKAFISSFSGHELVLNRNQDEWLIQDTRGQWQQDECLRLDITLKEHNQILDLAARSHLNYNDLINALDFSSKAMDNFIIDKTELNR